MIERNSINSGFVLVDCSFDRITGSHHKKSSRTYHDSTLRQGKGHEFGSNTLAYEQSSHIFIWFLMLCSRCYILLHNYTTNK